MREKGTKFISILMAVLMVFSMCVFTAPITADAQMQKKTSTTAVNSVYRGMIKDGNVFYMKTDDGITAYNIKTKKSKKLVKKINNSWGGMLKYKDYIYYSDIVNNTKCIYRVDVKGKKAPKLLCRNATIGFVYKDRLYYGNNGLCSMSLNGSKKRRYTRTKSSQSMMGMYVFYYKNRFFYGTVEDQYSVEKNYKNKRKSKDGYRAIINALNCTLSASSVEMKNGACWVDPDKSTGVWNTVTYSKKVGSKSIRKTIYKAAKGGVKIVASCDNGYMLIEESIGGDLKRSRIINLSGKVLATTKNRYK